MKRQKVRANLRQGSFFEGLLLGTMLDIYGVPICLIQNSSMQYHIAFMDDVRLVIPGKIGPKMVWEDMKERSDYPTH